MNAFVGYKPKPLAVDDLLELISGLKTENTYFFYRWSDSVSGIVSEAPTNQQFPLLEGQMFDFEYELRWKHKRQNTYEVLLLTIGHKHENFEALGKDWKIKPEWKIKPDKNENFPSNAYPAYGYGSELTRYDEPGSNKTLYDETRFPKSFIYANTLDIRCKSEQDSQSKNKKFKLAQRYFLDERTGIVHFVALTIEK